MTKTAETESVPRMTQRHGTSRRGRHHGDSAQTTTTTTEQATHKGQVASLPNGLHPHLPHPPHPPPGSPTGKPHPTPHTTLSAKDVHFMFVEPYILTGYRLPDQPWSYYVLSAFWLHNETFNVWTHAVGCLCVLARALFLGSALEGGGGGGFSDPRFVPVAGFALACFLMNLLSCLAHLLHSRSPRHHYLFFIMDYAGITLYNVGNAVGSMYSCSHPDTFRQIEAFYLPMTVVLCWLSFLVCVLSRLTFRGHFGVTRKVIMVSVLGAKAVFLAWPMVDRYMDCWRDEACSLSSLNHISIVFVFFALDGLSFLAHAPERWWPGRFDLWGHGHQWFHACTVLTQLLQLRALHVDLVALDRGYHAATSLDVVSMGASFLALAGANALTVAALSPSVDRKVQELQKDGHPPHGKEEGERKLH
ncbi:membrane progestin receptor alpha-B-like isoform X2 [Babylonia areolata]